VQNILTGRIQKQNLGTLSTSSNLTQEGFVG
jgi:hypothetical protein